MSSRAFSTTSNKLSATSGTSEVLRQISDYRNWRRKVRRDAILEHASTTSGPQDDNYDPDSVGFVPTMGALHAGHLDLVRHSLRENKHTVVSIFVNPAQFAPTEDLDSYPRTLDSDLEALRQLEEQESSRSVGKLSAVFCPDVREMYPPLPGTDTPFSQHRDKQQGAFMQVQGLSDVLEGQSRPGFFRGVATVVTKLWHVVEPTRVYFGQKDIQQAIILRALLASLLFQYPSSLQTESSFRLIPTTRDSQTGLALSSRNAYLSAQAMQWAPTLYKALNQGRTIFEGSTSSDRVSNALEAAEDIVNKASHQIAHDTNGAIKIELDYISLNAANTLQALSDGTNIPSGAVISGAMAVIEDGRRTRLIDNLLLGEAKSLIKH
ncbi:unnamed protein product [Sympodiomycopsis kandeliae]